ncbi:uncharacterized protein [Anabrus simplex]|uniref:uncharacterized protein isoform X1 n=1 Tax=Anabrus simplex TaxID=316456 RepID=UPI0035A3917B
MKVSVIFILIGTAAIAFGAALHEEPSESERVKRSGSGDILGLLTSKIGSKISSIASASSSSGHQEDPHEEYGPPPNYDQKSFDIWGFKKAILSTLLQAVKAIKGGIIALKGQLIKAKGQIIQTKGKIISAKGEAISNFGRHIATKALSSSGHSSSGSGHSAPSAPSGPSGGGYAPSGHSGEGGLSFPEAGYGFDSTGFGGYGDFQYSAPGYLPPTGGSYGPPPPPPPSYGPPPSAPSGHYGSPYKLARATTAQREDKQSSGGFPEGVQAGLLILKPITPPAKQQSTSYTTYHDTFGSHSQPVGSAALPDQHNVHVQKSLDYTPFESLFG